MNNLLPYVVRSFTFLLVVTSLSFHVSCSSDDEDQQIIDDLLSINDPNIYDFAVNRIIGGIHPQASGDEGIDINNDGFIEFTVWSDCGNYISNQDGEEYSAIEIDMNPYSNYTDQRDESISFYLEETQNECYSDFEDYTILTLERGVPINSLIGFMPEFGGILYVDWSDEFPQCGTKGEIPPGTEGYVPFQFLLDDNLKRNGWLRFKNECEGLTLIDGAYHLQPGAEILTGQR